MEIPRRVQNGQRLWMNKGHGKPMMSLSSQRGLFIALSPISKQCAAEILTNLMELIKIHFQRITRNRAKLPKSENMIQIDQNKLIYSYFRSIRLSAKHLRFAFECLRFSVSFGYTPLRLDPARDFGCQLLSCCNRLVTVMFRFSLAAIQFNLHKSKVAFPSTRSRQRATRQRNAAVPTREESLPSTARTEFGSKLGESWKQFF